MANFAKVALTFTENQTRRLAEWRGKRGIPESTSDDSFIRSIVIECMDKEVPKPENQETKKTTHSFE